MNTPDKRTKTDAPCLREVKRAAAEAHAAAERARNAQAELDRIRSQHKELIGKIHWAENQLRAVKSHVAEIDLVLEREEVALRAQIGLCDDHGRLNQGWAGIKSAGSQLVEAREAKRVAAEVVAGAERQLAEAQKDLSDFRSQHEIDGADPETLPTPKRVWNHYRQEFQVEVEE